MDEDFDVNSYVDTLLDGADLPQETVEAIRKGLAHENVAPKLKEAVMMRSDYSRNMDRIREQEKALADQQAILQAQAQLDHNNRELYEQLQEDYHRLQRELESLKSGDVLDDDEDFVSGRRSSKAVDPEEIKKLVRESMQQEMLREQRDLVNLVSETNKLVGRYQKEFGDWLDTQQLYDHAITKGLPLEAAYESFVAEKRESKRAAELKEKIEAARREGYERAKNEVGLPLVDNRPKDRIHALRPPDDLPKDSRSRVQAAVSDFLRGGA